jgi:hypothetical protein
MDGLPNILGLGFAFDFLFYFILFIICLEWGCVSKYKIIMERNWREILLGV